jgi:DNA-binding NarL/FixJ family response regulator
MAIQVLVVAPYALLRSALRFLLEGHAGISGAGEAANEQDIADALAHGKYDVLLLSGFPSGGGANGGEREGDLAEFGDEVNSLLTTILMEYPGLPVVVVAKCRKRQKKESKGRAIICVPMDSSPEELVHAILAAAPRPREAEVPGKEPPRTLTPRERQVCRLLAYGFTNVEVAEKLAISNRTVEIHRSKIVSKLALKNRAELVRYAIQAGLLQASADPDAAQEVAQQ